MKKLYISKLNMKKLYIYINYINRLWERELSINKIGKGTGGELDKNI